MNYPFFILILISYCCSALPKELVLERKSHPHFPHEEEHLAGVYEEKELIPATNLEDLIRQEMWLREQLERFPILKSSVVAPQFRFGHMSRRVSLSRDSRSDDSAMSESILLPLNQASNVVIQGIALVPACYPEHSTDSNYGFPKRFKIEAFTKQSPSDPILIADWTGEDFPDPGLYPVLFDVPNLRVNKVKLTVTKGSSDGKSVFFALSELMIFRANNNIVPPISQQIQATGGIQSPPYWSSQFLADDLVHLGKKAGGAEAGYESSADFIHFVDGSEYNSEAKIKLMVDLGEQYSFGRMELFAAKDTDTPIPSIPLPTRYKVEILSNLDPMKVVHSEWVENEDNAKIRWHSLNSADGRYLRITFDQLPTYNRQHVLALGEIRIIEDRDTKDVMKVAEEDISFTNMPSSQTVVTKSLIDGYANGREIISAHLHIKQLTKRSIVEKSYAKVVERLVIARAVRVQRYWTIGIIAAVLALFLLIIWLLHLKAQREKAVLSVQEQIAADLHDDISGNLGTISMISDRLRGMTDDAGMKDKLSELQHLSQESYSSVKEIIWHTDSDKTQLSDLFEQIRRTARSILSDCNVNYDFEEVFDDRVLSSEVRRNIILLVKESLYNCAKYAKAENISIRTEVSSSTLLITIQDDGCGFDSACDAAANSPSGRGLKNMSRRAKLLGANLTISSSLGEGTKIGLIMPMNTK